MEIIMLEELDNTHKKTSTQGRLETKNKSDE